MRKIGRRHALIVLAVLLASGWEISARRSGGVNVRPDAASRPDPSARFKDFRPVTGAMLENPDPADWLNGRRTLDGWGYSPLNQINRSQIHTRRNPRHRRCV